MPTAMTFTSLQSTVRSYLERGSVNDPTVYAMLPQLINFAERRISTELKVLGFKIPVVFTLQANLAVYALPDRWREIASINVGTSPGGTAIRSMVFPREYEYLRMYWPDDTATWTSVYGVPGVPLFWAAYDYNHIIFAPTPDLAYPCELIYYQEPPLLDQTNQQNWITQYAPNLLLYSTLLECTPFLKNDERIPTWQAMYDRTAGMLDGQDKSEILDNTSTRQKV